MFTRKAARTATLSGVLIVATLGLASFTASAQGAGTATAPPDSTVPAPVDTPATVPPATDSGAAATAAAPAAAAPVTPPGLPPAPVLPSNVEPVEWAAEEIQAVGSRNGSATQVLQQRLLDLGFWVSAPDGKYGFSTTQAVMAFQKYSGLSPTGKVDRNTASMLTFATEKAHGMTNAGTVVEVDKGRQLLFVVIDGKTAWAYNTSTGSGIAYTAANKKDPTKIESGDAQTPSGLFKTNRERPEGWWAGDLGEIYRPKYFNGGIAVHGMTSIPNRPVSHGCVRLSTMAMDFIWDSGLIPLKTTVWVHD